MNINAQSAVVTHIVNQLASSIGNFSLVDVGASGGIASYWSAFGHGLHAIGFDPLVANMLKMAATEKRPNVRYEAAFIGCNNALLPSELSFPRASSVLAQRLMRLDYARERFNDGEDVVRTEQHFALDEYFPLEAELDFLKVDTDGSDLQVLIGSEKLLQRGAWLGILVETQFQGRTDDYANTFANIDRYLRAKGFELYDLDRHRYTRAALPGLFEYNIPAQTLTGQALWGDALYFRDLADSHYESNWDYRVTTERLLKLVALFDLFGLPDCAAELLLARPELTKEEDQNHLLNLLVKSAGFNRTYEQHVKCFEESVDSFFPKSYAKPQAPQAEPFDERLDVFKACAEAAVARAEAAEAQLRNLQVENGQKQRLLDKYRRLFGWLERLPSFN